RGAALADRSWANRVHFTICVIVGCPSHVGMDTTHNGRGWKDLPREETETTQLNRTNFFRLTCTAPASYPATSSPPSQARAAWERSTPAAGGAPSGRRSWRLWPCES